MIVTINSILLGILLPAIFILLYCIDDDQDGGDDDDEDEIDDDELVKTPLALAAI